LLACRWCQIKQLFSPLEFDPMSRATPIDPQLEKNYNLRLLRDDLDSVIQQWVDRSAVTRANADGMLDCAYAEGKKDRLDIFRSGQPGAPLYVFVHGGYWQRGDKSIYSFIAEPFLNNGIDVALIGYPLCPDVSMTIISQKIALAVAWIYRNAANLSVSAERINLSGHSAGGHLTAMTLTQPWTELGDDLPVDIVKSGIPLSGLYQLEPLRHTTISDALRLSEEQVSSLSPQFLLPTSDAPVLTIVGGGETEGLHWQTDEFIACWRQHEVDISKHIEADVDHFDLLNRLADADSEIFQHISKHLK
jgi:arylformamidase